VNARVPEKDRGLKMAKVYRHSPGPDDYVGRVEMDGRVYGQRMGPDEYLGRVEEGGKIYQHLAGGPDRYLGRVERDGKIFRHSPGGLDDNVGRVSGSGRVHARRAGISGDEYLGRVEGEPLRLAGGAAYFLLLAEPDSTG
jgi:hypothetical protein